MMLGLCHAHNALPEAGGVLDQDVALLRWHAIVAIAEGRVEVDLPPTAEERREAFEASIPMVTL